MITDYQSRKNEVLEFYERVNQLLNNMEANINKSRTPEILSQAQPLLSDIKSKVERIKEDRFNLMIAGEAKSGKSTFINAYLGVELLPMDVKQCTSAIIEIKYGEKFCVKASYAGGKTKEIEGDEEAKNFLKENAALNDEYRDIPVPTINSEILIKAGKRADKREWNQIKQTNYKSNGRKKSKRDSRKNISVIDENIRIFNQDITSFLENKEVLQANIHNLPIDEYKNKIRKYIEANKNNWRDLVTKIEVEFPFTEELRGVEIIDSPGVCAHGGVAEITSGYISKADAIIFLKPISGQALEATQFNQFMRTASVERNKNALFLVLTRAAELTPNDLRRLEEEAYKQFSNLPKENILIADSKAQLYVHKFANLGPAACEEELKKLNEAGQLESFLKNAWMRDPFASEDKDFITKLRELSRFEHVTQTIERFGRRAHYLLLESLLQSIIILYNKLLGDLELQVELFRQKAEDPKELAQNIAVINQELETIKNKLNKEVGAVLSGFTGNDGLIVKTVDQEAATFKEELMNMDINSEDAMDNLEGCAKKKIERYNDLSIDLSKQMISEFDKKLISLNDKNLVPTVSLKPYFTEATFTEIRDSMESKAHETYSEEKGWFTFKEKERHTRYNRSMHVNLIRNNLIERYEKISKKIELNLIEYVDKIGSHYKSELKSNVEAKKKELDVIIDAKANAEEIQGIIKMLEQQVETIKDSRNDIEKLKGGIGKYAS